MAILLNLVLATALRHETPELWYSLTALAALVGTQIVFWVVTYPINTATANWTVLPHNWEVLLGQRWEYSHAAGAGLQLVAVMALLLWMCRR